MGIPELRVVEDLAASPGAATAVCAINPYPPDAAAGHPQQWHGRCSPQLDSPPGGGIVNLSSFGPLMDTWNLGWAAGSISRAVLRRLPWPCP